MAEANDLAARLKKGLDYSSLDDPRVAEASRVLGEMAATQRQKKIPPGIEYGFDENSEDTSAMTLLILLYRIQERIHPGPPIDKVGPEREWDMARLNAISVLTSAFNDEKANSYVFRFEALRKKLCKAAPSGHHTPFQYWVLAIKQIMIEEAINRSGLSLPGKPLVYYFPNGTVNALTFLIPNTTESLVLFEGGMQPFTNQLSKILVSAFSSITQQIIQSKTEPSPDQLIKMLGREKSSVDRFNKLLLAYLFLGNPIEGGFFTIQGREAAIAGAIEESMKLFAMGHEYGHILDSHTDPSDSATFAVGTRSWSVAKRTQAQEYDADRHGLRLMVEAMKRPSNDNVLSLCGPDVLLCSMGIVERALSIVKTGIDAEEPSDTHPPIRSRQDNLRTMIGSEYPGSEAAFAMMLMFETLLNSFFDQAKPLLSKYHEEKRPLANHWTSRVRLFS